MKTSELIGNQLAWAVTKCEDPDMSDAMADAGCIFEGYHYPTDWAQGGPIIEREGILTPFYSFVAGCSTKQYGCTHPKHPLPVWGETHLIAAMRCFVASKLGNEVEIPDELA